MQLGSLAANEPWTAEQRDALLVKRGRATEPHIEAAARKVVANAKREAARAGDRLSARAGEALDGAMRRLGLAERTGRKNILHRLGDVAEAIF